QRDEDDQRPGEQGRGDRVGLLALTPAESGCDERHGHGSQGASGSDLVHDVGDRIDDVVDIADPRGPDTVGEDEGTTESGRPGKQGEDGDEAGGPGNAPDCPAGHRGRPHRSSSLSTGVDSMTEVKLTRSDTRVNAVRPARVSSLPGQPRRWTTAVPTAAPAAFAPVSPSIDSPLRSGAMTPAAAPMAAALVTPPAPRSNGDPAMAVAFRVRPGRRSSRLPWLAAAAMTPAPTTVLAVSGRSAPRSTITAATSPVMPI